MRVRMCHCGRIHNGPWGAAGLVLSNAAGHVLLARRSGYVHRAGTWAFPGGAREPGETDAECALREAEEELGIDPDAVVVTGTLAGLDHGAWRYTYVLATLDPAAAPLRLRLNWETDDAAWMRPDEVHGLRLHPDLRTAWPRLATLC